ncbi:MAG: DUF1223 domain-containing protein [Sphingomicrobium sp.]
MAKNIKGLAALLIAGVTGGAALSYSASPAFGNDNAHPTVVELYQSQGCSSCPPAIANINQLAGRPDILALTFAVTYWDQLGWKDTFAKPAFTDRQRDYARGAGRGGVATPQTIINGKVVTNGGNRAQLIAAIRAGDRGASGPSISVAGGKVSIGKGSAKEAATIWLVHYDPRALDVPIRAGENGGRTLTHRNVVRSMIRIGKWNGAALTVTAAAPADSQWRSAILVQEGTGGEIVAAARI